VEALKEPATGGGESPRESESPLTILNKNEKYEHNNKGDHMNETKQLKNGTLCTYEPKTKGLPEKMKVQVRGVATVEQPVIGRMYIVEVMDGSLPNGFYEYKFIVAMECNLTEGWSTAN